SPWVGTGATGSVRGLVAAATGVSIGKKRFWHRGHSRHLYSDRHANRRTRHGRPRAGYLDASIVPDTETCSGRSISSGIEEGATTTVKTAANTCTNLQRHAARDAGNA